MLIACDVLTIGREASAMDAYLTQPTRCNPSSYGDGASLLC